MRDEQGLVAFAREIIGYAFDGMDADGADIQALALAHGLLVKEPYDPARHGPSMEAQPGDDWYTFAGPMVGAPGAALQSRAFEDGARGPFRVVRRVPRNVYRGDALVFIAATEHEAAEMVALLNAGRAALAEQEKGDA